MKLKKICFDHIGFRSLIDLDVLISPRVTVIAGHNGIGKSTILGLIANCSEFTSHKTLLNLSFRSDFSEIFFLDYYNDFSQRPAGASRANIHYDVDGVEVVKECAVSGSQKELINKKNYKKFMVKVDPKTLTEKQAAVLSDDNLYVYRMRVIPRTKNKVNPDIIKKYNIGMAAKLKIPTIYLGMSRVSPIGEFSKEDIEYKISAVSEENITSIYKFFNSVIPFTQIQDKRVYSHKFSKNNKQSLVPEFGHSSLTISLGQDSLSSIATAIVSFENLKKEMKADYPGGILIIDEVEAGLHPNAQKRLMNQLKKQASILDLQIIVTSHSLTIIKEALENTDKDSVVYLTSTSLPTLMQDVSYLKIKNDMLQVPFLRTQPNKITLPMLYVYFEDEEAYDFMGGILSALNITNTFSRFGKQLILVSAALGCSNLVRLSTASSHFINSLIVLDADTVDILNGSPADKKGLVDKPNVVLLPVTDECSLYHGLPPDKIAYLYLYEKYKDCRNNIDFWRTKTPDWFSTDHYFNIIYPLEQSGQPIYINSRDALMKVSRKVMKKWYKQHIQVFTEINLFKLWAEENIKICEEFVSTVSEKINLLSSTTTNGH